MTRALSALSLLLVVAARGQVLCSFETPEQQALVVASGTKVDLVSEHATDGGNALRVLFPGSEKDSWPGISFRPNPAQLLERDMLSFDVHNPGKVPVRLSWRIDDANGKKVFGGASVKPGTETLSIYLRALGEQLALAKVKQFLLYERMPREDMTLFFDNFRLADFGDSFTPLVYRQVEPAVPPTAADRERGYQLFSRHWLDFVFPSSRPRVGEDAVRLDAFATPGETEPLTVSIVALRDLKGARVTVGELVAEGGERIPAAAVSVYPIRCLDKRVTYSSKQFIRDVPVLLERRAQVDVPADTAKRFWLDVRVPADAAPGVYRGVVTFAAADTPSSQLPVRVRVLPFTLPEPDGMFFGEYYQGPRLAETEEDKRAFLERDMRDMRAHGMTSVGLCFGVDTKAATFEDGEAKLVFDGTTMFEWFMDLYRDLGFRAPVVMLSDSGQGFAKKSEADFGSPEYKRYYQAFWRAMQAASKARDWPELIVQPVDEPGWKDQEAKARNATLLKWLKEIPGMRTEQDGPGDGYFHGVAGPYADMWNYNGALGTEEVVAKAKAQGHLIVVYNCDVESYRPETQRYMAGFFQKRAGAQGCFNWAYMSFSGSPYSDFDFRTGTWMHVYPEWKDEVGGPSIGWTAYREGIDDYRYILALEHAMARSKDTRAVGEARQALASLLATIDYSPRVRNAAEFAGKRAVGDEFEVTGRYGIDNGWDFETYDVARWQLAEAVIRLSTAGATGTPRGELSPVPQPLLSDLAWSERLDAKADVARVARRVEIPRLDAAITVDGEFSEAVWRKAGRVRGLSLASGGKPQAQTQGWLFRTDTALCVAVECEEPFTDMMTASIGEDGGPVWKDDCVELFFDTNLDRTTFRQIAVNSLGKVFATDSTGATWTPKVQAAAKVLAGTWRVELVLPLDDLQATSTSFGFNLCRERRPTEVFELSCWSPTGGGFGEPGRFGMASFGASYFRSVGLGKGVVGPNQLAATVTNPTGKDLRARLVVLCGAANAPPVRTVSEAFTVSPGKTSEVLVPYILTSDMGDATIEARLEDTTSGAFLDGQRLSQKVAAPLALRLSPSLSFTSRGTLGCTVEVAVAKALRPDLKVQVLLRRDADDAVVSRTEIAGILGSEVSGLLHPGLAPGTYRLCGRLVGPDGEAIAEVETPLSRVRGPF